jgi:hypothetical protein
MNSRKNAFTPQRTSVFDTTDCIVCTTKISRSSAFKDALGQYWCKEHESRGKLLSYAAEHGYPAIQFLGEVKPCYPVQGLPDCERPMKYAIGFGKDNGNKELWQFAVVHGNDDMINAAIVHVGLSEEKVS